MNPAKDVSGKGVPAALFMVIGTTLIKDHTKPGRDLGEVFTEVNELLCESNSGGFFITVFEGVLDLVTGDRIFQYTDGVTEATDATNAGDELYGMEQIGLVLARNAGCPPEELLTRVKEDIDTFVGGAPQFDDITMLCLDYKITRSGCRRKSQLKMKVYCDILKRDCVNCGALEQSVDIGWGQKTFCPGIFLNEGTKMKLLFGTGNQAKLAAMKSRLESIGIELIGLSDLKAGGKRIPEVAENGNTPLENARKKALVYYEAFQMPVFSCDSGLYFDHVPDEVQPGVHVRNVNRTCLSDEEMLEYYAGLVKRYGNLVARYRNAICFIMDENHIYESMDASLESEKFILTDKPHSAVRKKGFPLDSMSIDIKTNRYYYDLPAGNLEQFAVEDGFLMFFKKVLNR